MCFVSDVLLIVAVVGGAFVALLVLGDVLPTTATTRGVLVIGGCLILLALGGHEVRQIASLYRIRLRTRKSVDNAGGASAYPGESA